MYYNPAAPQTATADSALGVKLAVAVTGVIFFRDGHDAAIVRSARRADEMRQLGLMALRAFYRRHR